MPIPDLTGPGHVALVTGGSRGLGRALIERLVHDGWHVVTDGRDPAGLARAVRALTASGRVTAVPGDVSDPGHRADLAAAVTRLGRLDALVNNASDLGPTPLPPLADVPADAVARVLAVNVSAPLALAQLVLPLLRTSGGCVVNLSSDAAVEAYPGWGAYGAAKAALDHLSAVMAVEEPAVRVHALDPGDMATDMHAAAVPDADPAQLTDPAEVVPALVRLLTEPVPSGRHRAADLLPWPDPARPPAGDAAS
ncbi:MAG: SDR family NAD(P)-dependent oxidoreductase [Kineosporiaceae bacterium]